MYRLGSKVIIIHDTVEQRLPLHAYGYIIAYERSADNLFAYIVRIPTLNKNVFVCENDIKLEAILIKEEAERLQKEALIDFALATRNRELFYDILNGQPNRTIH
jgi:hypothetical protein